MVITSTTQNNGNNICQKQGNNICQKQGKEQLPIQKVKPKRNTRLVHQQGTKPIKCPKIAGHTNTMTPPGWKIIEINIFFRPEEAMLGTGKSLSYL